MEVRQLGAGRRRGEVSVDGAASRAALGFQGGDPARQGFHVAHRPRRAAPLDDADLDLGQVEPRAMLEAVVEFYPLSDGARRPRRDGLVERRRLQVEADLRAWRVLHRRHCPCCLHTAARVSLLNPLDRVTPNTKASQMGVFICGQLYSHGGGQGRLPMDRCHLLSEEVGVIFCHTL